MTITFTTTITGMEAYPVYQEVPLYVFRVYWNYLGDDSKFSTAMQGSTDVPTSDPQSATPYADLTLEQVMGWVQTYTPKLDVGRIHRQDYSLDYSAIYPVRCESPTSVVI